MKRILSMLLCLVMIFSLISSFSTCFAIADIGIYYDGGAKTADGKPSAAKMGIGTAVKNTDGSYKTVKGDDLKDHVELDANAKFDWNNIFTRYKNVIIGISGVAALSFLVFFIINFMKLGQSSGNPQMRSQALMGIVWCGIACAGLGGIAIFFGFFYNALA